jgi:GNAT superfamily N-acetyltransferase
MADKAKLAKFRYVQREDLSRVLAIEAANHLFANPDNQAERVRDRRQMAEDDLFEFVGKPRTRVGVLVEGGQAVGFLLLDCGHEQDKDAVVVRLSVGPKRQGYGTLLLEEAERLARLADSARIVAYAYEEDLAAQSFFKARGWRASVARRHYDGLDAVRFVKTLA